MGLWDWVKQLLGGTKPPAAISPRNDATSRRQPDADRLQPDGAARSSRRVRPDFLGQPPAPRGQPVAKPARSPAKTAFAQLEAGAFAPLSDDEIRRRAKGAGRSLWNAWFGRRDLIPPANDPRTQLIDAAMVGHGFFDARGAGRDSPRRRSRWTKSGRTSPWPRPRPRPAMARSEEERAALKAQKKAEAAERKKQAGRGGRAAARPATSCFSAAASPTAWPTAGPTSKSSSGKACRSSPRRPTWPPPWG